MLAAAIALVWALGLVSAWADHTVVSFAFAGFLIAIALLADWLIETFGPGIWRFVRSVALSVAHALRDDEQVRALVARHPRVFGWLGRRVSTREATGLYLTVTAVLGVYFFSGFVSIARSLVLSRAFTDYDPQILALLRVFRTPALTRVLWIATVLSDARVIALLLAVAAVMLVMWGRRAEAALLVVTLSGGTLVQALAGLAFRRPRPPAAFALIKEPSSYSFPSGPAFASLLFAGVIVFVLWRTMRSLRARLAAPFVALFVVVAIGVSRVYLGIHWPSDVIASWSLALAWLCVMCGCYLMLVRYRGTREVWPAWTGRPARRTVTIAVSIVAITAVVTGAQFDPLLAQVTAETPTHAWSVATGPTGLPAPTAADLHQLPLFSEKFDGTPQEPIGIVFIGTRSQLTSAFEAQGWLVADTPSLATLARAAVAAIGNRSYPTAPVTPTFLAGAVQDIAFEKPEGTATVRRRHHARFWQTHRTLDGVPVWVATASFDSHLEIASTIPLPTHHIDPNIDAEQAYVVGDLLKSGRVTLLARLRVTNPSTGTNAQGDQWFTQGIASVVEATK